MTETTDQPHRSGFVSIIGRTNVGKSTLLNRLVGEKVAIVTPVSQTTRHRILGVKNLPGGQIAYLDTPGFHKPKFRMNRDMVQTASDTLREADVVLCMIDASTGLGPGDRFVFARLKEVRVPIVLALNKIDLLPRPRLLPLIEEVHSEGSFQEIVPISAAKGTQCAELERALLGLLPQSPSLYPEEYLTDQPERLLAAEMIREQVLLQTRQEIPHAVSVVVDRYSILQDESLRIEAIVYVERESQRAIVVGKNGQKLKEIGSRARKEIGLRFERPASVFLWVKVHPNWRQDAVAMERWRRSGMASG